MSHLTWEGFLKKKAQKLLNTKTESISKVAKLKGEDSKLAPVMLFTKFKDFKPKKVLMSEELWKEWKEIYTRFNSADDFIKFYMENETKSFYGKLVRTFNDEQNWITFENKIKADLLAIIKEMKEQKKITTYRIYTDLKINMGNCNKLFKDNDVTKIALDTLKKIETYVKNYA